MSTNFYYIKKLSRKERDDLLDNFDKQIAEIRSAINNNTVYQLPDDWGCTISNLFPKEYHIGKRSYKWQFLWEHTLGKNLEEIKKFLSNPDIIIYNEYSKSFSCEEFFEEIEDCLYTGKRSDEVDYLTKDGLRFSNYEDFG